MTVFEFRAPARAKYCEAVVAIFFVLMAAGLANAQGGVGSTRGLPEGASGNHRIQGVVFLPNGRRAAEGILIKLDSNVGTRRAATDGSGEFSFNSLPASNYALTVDGGPDYEPVQQSVIIYGNTGDSAGMSNVGDTTKLDIHLRPKAVSDAVLFAGVPKEAVDNYKKAKEAAHASNDKKAAQQAVELLNSALTAYP